MVEPCIAIITVEIGERLAAGKQECEEKESVGRFLTSGMHRGRVSPVQREQEVLGGVIVPLASWWITRLASAGGGLGFLLSKT